LKSYAKNKSGCFFGRHFMSFICVIELVFVKQCFACCGAILRIFTILDVD